MNSRHLSAVFPLAAQMLNDDSVTKSETMMKHLGGVINDETKRLRFLVEKVLQMSMFDRKRLFSRKKELDLNKLVEIYSQYIQFAWNIQAVRRYRYESRISHHICRRDALHQCHYQSGWTMR